MQKQYKITGIRRNLPDNVADDFSCAEIINLREKNGVWRPTGEKEEIITDNPMAGEIQYTINENCVACGACVANCPYNAIIYNSADNNYHINQSDCIHCGNCYESCNYNAVEYARIFQDNQKMTLFLHTTGDTKQLIGWVNGSVKYFDFPNGKTVSAILDLPQADAGRKVRFNAVGNILVIFVEPETGKAPYTKYAIWKADANNVKRYYLLPELSPLVLDIGLKQHAVTDDYIRTGTGLLVGAYRTAEGFYLKQSPIYIMDYGNGDNGLGKAPYLLYKDIWGYIPEEWRDIITDISIFSTTPQKGISNINFIDYVNNKDTSIFYKVYSLASANRGSFPMAEASSMDDYDHSNNFGIKGAGGQYQLQIAQHLKVNSELTPAYIEFKERSDDSNTFYLFEKYNSAQCKLSINVSFSTEIGSIIDDAGNAWPFTHNARLSLVRDGVECKVLKVFETAGSYSLSIDVEYNDTVEIVDSGLYQLMFFYGINVSPGMKVSNFTYNPHREYFFKYVAEELDKDGRMYSLINIPKADVLKTKEPLATSPLNHDLYGNCDMNYNSRLFLGDTTSLLFRGYSPKDYGGDGEHYYLDCPIQQSFVTFLHTDDGEKVVHSGWTPVYDSISAAGAHAYYIKIPSLICYPDYRAYRAQLYLRQSGKTYKFKEYELTANKDGNYAWYYAYAFFELMSDEWLRPTTLYPDGGIPEETIHIPSDITEITGIQEAELPAVNDTLRTVNNTAVSALHLPMCYPAKHYNIVGNKNIIAFSANNLSIDATNFGIYPVFVFSENGVYAMELGTGDVLITRIVPLSGDVCIDKNSVTNIGRATLFASMDGLRILQGQRSEKITELLENYTGNPLTGNRHFNAILEKYGMTGFISPGDFQTFLNGAKTYLAYKENEVIITNEAFPYSYLLHLNDGIKISKISERYYNILNDYPNAYGTSENGAKIYSIGSEQLPAAGSFRQTIFVQTNAFKLGADEFEKIDRLITRLGVSPMNAAHCGIGIYLFASNDTRKWAWVDACEITPLNAPDGALNAAPLRCPNSAKYGMLVIAGEMNRTKDFITHISIDYQKRYDNKIR